MRGGQKMNIWILLLLGFFIIVGFFGFYWLFQIIKEQKRIIQEQIEKRNK